MFGIEIKIMDKRITDNGSVADSCVKAQWVHTASASITHHTWTAYTLQMEDVLTWCKRPPRIQFKKSGLCCV